MSDPIYIVSGKEVTKSQLAKTAAARGIPLDKYITLAGATLSGKTTDSADVTDPNAESVNTGSTLENGSLEPVDPFSNYYVTPEDLRNSEENVSPALNKKLSGVGISTSEGTSIGGLNALNLKSSKDVDIQGPGIISRSFSEFTSAIGIGEDKTDEELAEAAAEINAYIKEKGDIDYISKAKERSGDAYEKYTEYITAPDVEDKDLKASMKEDLVSEFSRISRGERKNITRKVGGEMTTVGIEETPATVDDFKSEEEYNAYKQWKKDGYIQDFSESEVVAYDEERKRKFALDASSEYASDTNASQRIDVLALAADDEKKLTNLQEEANKFFDIQDAYENSVQEYKLNPTNDNFMVASTIELDYLREQGKIQSLQNKLKADGTIERSKSVPLALMDFNKDYNRMRQLRSSFKSLGTDIAYGAAQLSILAGSGPMQAAYLSSPALLNSVIDDTTGLVSLGQDMQVESERFQRAIQVDEINSISDAGRWVAGSTVNLIPSLSMAFAGPAAMPLFFMSGSGGKGLEIAINQKNASERMIKNKQFLIDNPDLDVLESMSLEQQMEEDAKTLNLSSWQTLGVQALYGVAEVAFERLGTMSLLKNVKNGIKMLPPTTIKEGFNFVGKQLVQGIRVEGGSEFATTVAQNFGDIFILGEDKNLFEGGLESFAQGALMGGGMNSINISKGLRQGYTSVMASKAESQKLENVLQAIRKITGEPKIQGWGDVAGLKLKLPKETQDVVDSLIKDMQQIEQGVLFKLGTTLSVEQAYAVEEKNRAMRLINKQLINASNNPNISPAQLKNIEAELRVKFDALAKDREALLSDSTNAKETKNNFTNTQVSLDSSLGYAYYQQSMLTSSVASVVSNYNNLSPEANQLGLDEAKEELIKLGEADPSIDAIKDKALNTYIDNTYKEKINQGRANAETFAEQQGLDLEVMSFEGKDSNAEIIAAFENAGITGSELAKLKKAVRNGSFEGGQIPGTNKVIVNMDAAVKNRRIGIFAHEILHAYAREKYKGNQKAIDLAGADLLAYLEKNDADLFARVQFRIDQSYTEKDAEGNVIKDADYFEEAMNAMSDVLADGQSVNESAMNKIRVFANSFLSGLPDKFQFKKDQGRDAYEFVKNYNKAAHFGGKGDLGNKITSNNDKPDEEIPANVKQSITKSAAAAEQALNNIPLAQLKGARAQTVIGTELPGMVKAQVIGRFNISSQAAQDFTDDVIEKIYLAQETTKWDGRGTLSGFIGGRIALRIKDVVRAEYKRNPEERRYLAGIDTNQFETLENASDVIDEGTSVQKAEKPKYKKLKDSNVLPGTVINELKLKLIPILRVLKSKINAPSSLNAKVKPIIAELKKEFGKQFDIVLKKAMGGKKDGQLNKFLIKNKKAILENMTTTWLMGAMPGAIQKQVDSKFTSNWEGKKIDRETTTTDNAGRTAGADIVRRKPNVANMSDAEFLGYVVDEKGNPIRGRKESLAKALGEELGFETFLEEIQKENSSVNNAFVANQELLGAIMADNLVEQVADMIDRGTIKYSEGATSLTPQQIQSQLMELVTEATIAGADSNSFENIKAGYPDIVVKIGEDIGLFTYFDEGKTGFKKPLADFDVPQMFEEQFYTYFNTITNKNVEVSMEQLAKFSETLIDILPPELLRVLPDDMFGLQHGYLMAAENANNNRPSGKYVWLARKKREKQKGSSNIKLPFDPKGIEIFNAGYGLMGGIATILNNEYPSIQAKQDAVMEKFGERIASANATNKIALDYLMNEASKILAKKPELVPGFLRWMEASTSNAKAQRGLTTLDLIEYRAESQKLGEGHPLYAEAVAYATEFSTEIYNRDNAAGRKLRKEITLQEFIDKRLANPKTGPNTHLRFKGEHVTPAANVMVDLAKNAIGAARLLSKNPVAEVQVLADLSLKNSLTLENYSQTLGAKLYSDIQDQALGATSKLGDLRNLVLKESDFNNFYSIDGRTGVEYVKDKVISIDAISQVIESIDIESLANTISGQTAIDLGVKYSKTPKKIRVFDFDDTLARTKSNVLYTMPGEVPIYHGGSISSIKNITGSFVYFSQDQSQASEYAKGNDGEVNGFVLNESDIASEEDVFKVIRELGIQPKEKGWTVDDSRLYELIDDRFEQSFSKSDLSKLIKALANKGIKASRFTDSDLKSGKDTDNIVVFDKKSVKEQSKINAATFAKEAGNMEAEGAVWDFSEFSKVMNGTKGPLFEVAKIIGDKSGTQDLFVLTARPQDAAGPIQEFLSELGLDIPLENITGLGNGTPKAKADWVVNKLAEGYNDFYFADDHTGNVKAVKDALSTLDVKSKVQQARIKFSQSLDADFNNMIERNKGVNANAEFSKVVAKRRGASIGRFKLWMPSSLDDFKGLTSYVFAGKGRQGDADQKFFKDALITPYFRGVAAIETARQTLKNDFKALNKAFKPVRKKLGKLTPDGDFTYDAAIRVYLWTQAGIEVPGISKRDQAKLNKLVEGNDSLVAYAKALMLISKKDSWNPPAEYWDSGTILSDLNEMTEKIGRKEYIAEFIENVDIIFSEKNLNKVQALYGTRQRDALEDIIYRMKNGTNRPSGGNKTVNRWNNWVNNSVGAIMFFNRRSALLQLLSTVNFINWSDNNPAKAALAFANQPQYWKDFVRIFNSDKLKQRRSGLKSDVNEAEIANAAKGAKNKASAVISYLLKIGFTPTQLADSFAISAGGAAFYRNRVKTLVKKGMTLAQAEKQAFQDFSEISEETQQSGDAALISSDQASVMGRLILAFQNTPIQLNRSIKKAALDIYNRRRTPGQTQAQSDFSNLSKMVFYGAIQNIIFSTLQNALFALLPGFDDDELTEDELDKLEETKISRILNNMVDTTLKGGFGLPGAVVSTIKNVVQEYNKQDKKGFTADHTYTILQVANLSPPIGSKLRKIYSAIQAEKFEKDVIAERGFDVTLDGKFNLSPSYNVLGAVVEGATNLPLERVTLELQSLTEAMDTRNTIMQRIALGLGWKSWDVGAENEEHDLIKLKAKAERKEQGKIKAKKTRARNKEIEKQRVANLSPKEKAIELAKKKEKQKLANEKRRQTNYKKALERNKKSDSLKAAILNKYKQNN